MKNKQKLVEYLANPITIAKISKYTYLLSTIMTLALTIGWFILMWGRDIAFLGFLWLFIAYKTYKMYKELKECSS